MVKKKAIINNKQFRDILICIMWPATITYGSGILAREVGRDMWISGIIGVFTVLVFVIIIINVGLNYPDKTIVEYCPDLLGSFLGKIMGVLISVYFFLCSSSSISMYIQHLTGFLLPETPFLVVCTLHVFIICYLVWEGPEVIGRISVIAFVMAVFFYLLVFMASLSEINIDRITPFFDSGVLPVFKASLSADTFIGITLMIIAMIFPMVQDKKKAIGSATSGLFIGAFFFVFYFIVELMVMGPHVVAIMRIPSMDFVRSIQITQYLHRFESFMVALWYWSIMNQAGIFACCSLTGFVQTFEMKKKKHPIIIMIIFGMALLITTYYIGHNDVIFLKIREYIWGYISIPIDFGVPLILIIALGIKKMQSPNKK